LIGRCRSLAQVFRESLLNHSPQAAQFGAPPPSIFVDLGVGAPHAHPIRARKPGQRKVPKLNEVSKPRPRESGEPRPAGSLVVQEDKAVGFVSAPENGEWRQI